MDYYHGTSTARPAFGDLDLNYRLKTRAFIEICMPPMFSELERKFRMFALRKKGIAPIMFYLDFQAAATPLAFGRDVETSYTVAVHRAVRDSGDVRLLLDLRSLLKAHRGSGSAEALGFEKEKGPLMEVGTSQVLQVFTRPLAPPGEREVTELPEELAEFDVLPWDRPYPGIELLQQEPRGYTESVPGASHRFTSVWGLSNTDINQHVNVEELMGQMESQFSRLVSAAGLPLERHRIRRVQLVFRRPFFPGQAFGVKGRLWLNGAQTLFTGGLHAIAPEGEWASGPNLAARCEGEVAEG